MPLLSIIVLNFNGKRHNSRCLNSLLPQLTDCELIFADNASTDESFEQARTEFSAEPIVWVQNGANLGYAQGNNAAAKAACGKFLLFLNNDTDVEQGAIPALLDHLRHLPELAGGQCALVRDDERTRLQAAGVDVDIFGFQYARNVDEAPESLTETSVIFTGVGAALVVAKEWFERVGGFDASYFLLCEETDLCWRIGLAGGEMRYFPDVRVYHVGAGTRVQGAAQLALFTRNRVRTLRKNLGPALLPPALCGHVAAMLLLGLLYRVRGETDMSSGVLSGLRDGLRDPSIRASRQRVQSTRRLSDWELIRKGLLRFPDLKGLLKNREHYS